MGLKHYNTKRYFVHKSDKKKGDPWDRLVSIGLRVSVCLRYQNEGQAGAKILDFLDNFLEEFLQLVDQRLDLEPLDRSQFGCVLLRTTTPTGALS